MIKEQFFGHFADFGLGVFTLKATRNYSAALQSRGAAVEDENRLCAEKEKLADSAEEA